MDSKNIITNEEFYLTDGGKIHFYYEEDDDAYYLCDKSYSPQHDQDINEKIINKFYIPNTINNKPVIGIEGALFEYMTELSSFVIEDDNQYFRVYEGGLYSKDMTSIIRMPPKYQHKIFCVPNGVKKIMDSAISNKYIETLVIQQGCDAIYEYGVSCAKSLKRLYLPKSVKFIGFKAFIWTKPADVFYEGSKEDKEKIDFTDLGFNSGLLDAKWHYECDLPKDINIM